MMKPRVFVTRRIPDRGLDLLNRYCEITLHRDEVPPAREVILREVAEKEALLCLPTDRVDREVMEAGRDLQVISTFSVGYEHIDLVEATRRGIYVGYTPDVLTEATADLAFALLLAAARRIVEADRFLREGRWTTPLYPLMLLADSVWGATIGIIGMGRIGMAVARRARGFGMRILYSDAVRLPDDDERNLAAEFVAFDDLLKDSDFVTIHTPLNDRTRGLIGERELLRMKPTAILINTSRGPTVDEEALVKALKEGWIKRAALDVYEREPIDPDHPLIGLPNVVLLPHLGSATTEARNAMAELAAMNVINVLTGTPPLKWLNPEVAGVRPLQELA
jgi:glyoxylate reductase